MLDRICVYVDFLYYNNNELCYIRDLIFKNFPINYNFYIDCLDFVIQELNDKDIIFDINNLSMDFSFGSLDSLNEFLGDISSEEFSRCCYLIDCHE